MPAAIGRVERADGREHMIEENLGLVVTIARRYRGRGLPLEDLVQEGAIGLIRAVDLYDPGRGVAFATYATWWIRQSIGTGLARSGRAIRLPGHVERRLGRIRAAELELGASLGRPATAAEIGAAVGCAAQDVELLRLRASAPVALDDPAGREVATMADRITPTPEGALLDAERREVMARALARLDARSRRILRARYGIGGRAERSLADLGRELCLSRERVRQIHGEALDRLAREAPVRALRDAA